MWRSAHQDRITKGSHSDLIDTVRLDGGVDEFRYELPFEILQKDSLWIIGSCTQCAAGVLLHTSRKNFLAPTAKAFFRAASKSCAKARQYAHRILR